MFTVNIVGKIQSTIKNSFYVFGLLFLHENSLKINKHFVRILIGALENIHLIRIRIYHDDCNISSKRH